MEKNASLYLKKTEAYARKSLIDSGVRYKILFCLRKGEKYQAFSRVKFKKLSEVSRILI